MLVAHLVPGYLAAQSSRAGWRTEWGRAHRSVIWTAALFSTFAPDLDVIYHALFRGFINHSTLWTHSLFVHLGVACVWLILVRMGRYPYLRKLVGLVAAGGASHLVLDVLSHGTPLLYPASMLFVGMAPTRVVQGGFWAYLTDPIFLAEPFLLALALAYHILNQKLTPRGRKIAIVVLASSWTLFTVTFLFALPTLQKLAESRIAN